MKTKAILLALSLVLLMSLSVVADVPDEITYQGRLLYNGTPVTSATNIVFALYQTSGGGSAVWTEIHSSVTPDSDGIYTVVLGSTVAIPDDYDALWLELEVAGNTLTPRKKLTSAPYALNVGTLPSLSVTGTVTANAFAGSGAGLTDVPVNCDGDPSTGDSDFDGICDNEDSCEGFDDRDDVDGDAVPNGCDPCPLDNPDDSDGDFVCDSQRAPDLFVSDNISIDNSRLYAPSGAGSVGIGTTSPSTKLDVDGAIRSKQIKIESSGTHEALDVSGCNTVALTQLTGSVVINGLSGGVAGQILHIFKVQGSPGTTVTIRHRTSAVGGEQIMVLSNKTDLVLGQSDYAKGVTLVNIDGWGWYEIDH